MSIGLIVFLLILVMLLLYLITIIANILEGISTTENTPEYLNNIGSHITEIATTPISSFMTLLEEQSPILYIGLVVIALFVVYVLLKNLFGKKDSNPKDSDYKIAKHGSHGSARWSKDNEIFNDGTFVGLNEDKAYRQVLKNMKRGG